MTGIRKKNKILGFIFAVLAVWMVIFQNPSYAAQRCSLNVKTEQAGMTVYLYRVAEKQAGVYVLNEKFQAEFDGMTFEKVECEDLASVRPMMLIELQKHFTERDHAFLMSFKRGQPDWALFDYPNAADLPAIRWKLQNINKLAKNQAKHQEQLDKLKQVLDDWLVNANAE